MSVVVRGSRTESATPSEIRKATEFFAKKLLGERLSRNVCIDVIVKRKLARKTGALGWCDFVDNQSRPRFFEIELDDEQGPIRLIRTLAHEMVHVKQWAKGDLKEYSRKPDVWFGEPVDRDMPYRDRPWEIEAYELEKTLSKEFFSWRRNQKKLARRVDK